MDQTRKTIEADIRKIVETSGDDDGVLGLRMYVYLSSMYRKTGIDLNPRDVAVLVQAVKEATAIHMRDGRLDREAYIAYMSERAFGESGSQ